MITAASDQSTANAARASVSRSRYCFLSTVTPTNRMVPPLIGHDLGVDEELGLADGLLVLARTLPGELHPKCVLAGRELGGDERLLRRNAEEVVDVVQLFVLEEQRVPAEARAAGKDAARAVRPDLDVGPVLVHMVKLPAGLRVPSMAYIELAAPGHQPGGDSKAEKGTPAAQIRHVYQPESG
jgi:hypothetical protein